MDLKRDLVKYVRDKAKSGYKKETQCFICGDTEKLEFHHFYGMTELLETWLNSNKITINSNDFSWPDKTNFLNLILKSAQYIDRLYFTGG